MSVRAYRINKIEYEKGETFNLWHNDKLMAFLEGNGLYETLNEGTGLTEVAVDILEQALEQDLADENDQEIEKSLKDNIKKDIEWAKKNKLEYIQYYCF